jgi:hypothetical protein
MASLFLDCARSQLHVRFAALLLLSSAAFLLGTLLIVPLPDGPGAIVRATEVSTENII